MKCPKAVGDAIGELMGLMFLIRMAPPSCYSTRMTDDGHAVSGGEETSRL